MEKVKAEPKPIVYATDKDGKEIKFPRKRPNRRTQTKHTGSKKGNTPTENYKGEKTPKKLLSNHERVIAERAKRLGITVAQYKERFS